MAIDNDALLAAIEAAKDSSYGSDEQSSLGQRRAKSIEYYFGLNTNPAPEGRSQIVDRSVYETIQVMLPSLVRIFASSSDEICKAQPIGPNDEQAAEQTTAVLNWIVRDTNNWEQIAADWIHDALLLNNSYCLAYWDETENLVREVYEGQSDDQVALLLQDKNVTVLQHSESVDKEASEEAQQAFAQAQEQWQMMAAQAQVQGQPVPPPPQAPGPILIHDLVIERRENDGKVCVKVLPPENCFVSSDTPNWTLDDCPYFEFREKKTISALRSMGLDVPLDVNDDELNDSDEGDARDRFGEDRELDGMDGLMRQVWARMVWIRCEAENDGQARMYYAILVGKTVLYVEPCSRINVSSMTAQPLPHRHVGMSIAETVTDIQDIRTAVTRGALDNLYLANNGRHVISDRVNLDDFLDSRPGGAVRMIDGSLPGEGHIMPLVHPFAFNEIVGSLEYFDQVRQNRTGASRYFSGTDAGAINKTAAGTSMLQNMASMRIEHIARMMAPAVEALFSAVHEIWSKHRNKALTIKLRGNWTTVDPQAWRTKRDVRISVGVGAGNKESMMMMLQQVLATQMQVGLPLGLVTRDQVRETNLEILKLGGFSNPDRFWPDTKNLPPMQQQPSPEMVKAQAAKELKQMELQADAQKFQAEVMHKMEELRANLELQATNDMRDATREAQKMENDKAIAEMQAMVDKYKADLASKTAIELEMLKIQDNSAESIDEVHASIASLRNLVSAPKTIIRDPETNRVAGVQVEMPEEEAEDGKITPRHDRALSSLAESIGELKALISAPKMVVRDPETNRVAGVQVAGAEPAEKTAKPGNAMSALVQSIEELKTLIAAPKRLVRDENGRVLGVQ